MDITVTLPGWAMVLIMVVLATLLFWALILPPLRWLFGVLEDWMHARYTARMLDIAEEAQAQGNPLGAFGFSLLQRQLERMSERGHTRYPSLRERYRALEKP
jgi:hypothetical protein